MRVTVALLLLLSTAAHADDFGDCFARVEGACHHQVDLRHGCAAEQHAAEMAECEKKHTRRDLPDGGFIVSTGCGWTCSYNQSEYDACIGAATIACATLIPKGKP